MHRVGASRDAPRHAAPVAAWLAPAGWGATAASRRTGSAILLPFWGGVPCCWSNTLLWQLLGAVGQDSAAGRVSCRLRLAGAQLAAGREPPRQLGSPTGGKPPSEQYTCFPRPAAQAGAASCPGLRRATRSSGGDSGAGWCTSTGCCRCCCILLRKVNRVPLHRDKHLSSLAGGAAEHGANRSTAGEHEQRGPWGGPQTRRCKLPTRSALSQQHPRLRRNPLRDRDGAPARAPAGGPQASPHLRLLQRVPLRDAPLGGHVGHRDAHLAQRLGLGLHAAAAMGAGRRVSAATAVCHRMAATHAPRPAPTRPGERRVGTGSGGRCWHGVLCCQTRRQLPLCFHGTLAAAGRNGSAPCARWLSQACTSSECLPARPPCPALPLAPFAGRAP